MEGTLLDGRYRLIQHVGIGGMAAVYKAEDIRCQRIVAAKIMNPGLIHNQDFVQRFLHEVEATRRLSHINIINVMDFGRYKDMYYMIMEYVEGTHLKNMIIKKGSLSTKETISVALQVCQGLAHAHKKGIIHRDIKPQNILIARNGIIKIADFGIARITQSSLSLTKTGIVMGSVHYFSPEQARGLPLNYATDVYSLGVVIYEVLTGRLPFNAKNSVSVALQHISDPIPDPRLIKPRIDNGMCHLVYKACQKQPSERYKDAQEMLEALDALFVDDDSQDKASEESYDPIYANRPSRVKRYSKSRSLSTRSIIFVSVLSLLIVVIILILLK